MIERAKAITRLIIAALTIINAIMTASGHSPIPVDEGAIYETVSNLSAAAATLWVWWKNNNITAAAISAQNDIKWFNQEYDVEVIDDETDEAD